MHDGPCVRFHFVGRGIGGTTMFVWNCCFGPPVSCSDSMPRCSLIRNLVALVRQKHKANMKVVYKAKLAGDQHLIVPPQQTGAATTGVKLQGPVLAVGLAVD